MPTWEARVSGATAPADRVDAEVRYAFAAPLLRDAALWIDLGCGTGVAAGAALAGGAVARAVLVDRSAEALAQARRECGAEVIAAVEADLETAEGIAAVRAAIAEARGGDGATVVTCFDVLHQLTDFTALVELLLALGAEGATVVLSVPDDAAGALDDPHRATAWSAGAAEELRRLMPEGAVVARQVPVRAAAIVVDGESAPLGTVSISADQSAAHHLLAFGPDVARLTPVSHAHAAPLDDERADARRRESDLAYLEARVAQLEGPGA
ncbi:MAG TPA: methyltransferase domain-containing protein [Baekduia sp.]|jgi:SAM-dependent methyltransferase